MKCLQQKWPGCLQGYRQLVCTAMYLQFKRSSSLSIWPSLYLFLGKLSINARSFLLCCHWWRGRWITPGRIAYTDMLRMNVRSITACHEGQRIDTVTIILQHVVLGSLWSLRGHSSKSKQRSDLLCNNTDTTDLTVCMWQHMERGWHVRMQGHQTRRTIPKW